MGTVYSITYTQVITHLLLSAGVLLKKGTCSVGQHIVAHIFQYFVYLVGTNMII